MLLLFLFINQIVASKSYNIVLNENSKDVTACVSKIIKDFYKHGTEVTFVDINYPNPDKIVQAMASLHQVSVATRTTARPTLMKNEGYVLAAGSPQLLLKEIKNLEREPEWSPSVKFLIIIDTLTLDDLPSIFQTLLKLSIVYAVVIDSTNDPILFTYNPFENYGCGKRFDRIIEKGNCLGALNDIFFYKYVTGLRNCTFRANSAHWPPFSIDQTIDKGPKGIEEYIINIYSEREHFKTVHYNYSNDAENYSMISQNLSAVGPLVLVQEKADHMMYGGMLLTNSRARAFDFIWMHLSYMDDVRILVKTATDVASWRNSYLEFSLIVWVALISVLVVYYILVILLLKPKDKVRILFKMCDYFFQHGSKIAGNFRVKVVFLYWIWFAYLISSIYHSSLVGLITNPSKNYQISNSEDIAKYNLKPCISPVMANYFYSVQEVLFPGRNESDDRCNTLMNSIRSVSESDDLYTMSMYSVYSYYKHTFYDEWGNSGIYEFKNPTNNVIYAIYLYKGFPLVDNLQKLSLRLRENGLIDHHFHHIIDYQKFRYVFTKQKKKFHVVVPWYVFVTGSIISTIVFIVEINRKPNQKLQRQRTKLILTKKD